MAKHIKVIIFILISLFLVVFTAFYLGRTMYLEIRDGINNYKGDKILGGDRDEHGCIGSAGYSWCEKKNKCLRVWEEPCEEPVVNGGDIPLGNNSKCGIENCHGLEIECGSNPAEMCTAMYALGDKCRQYASCGIVNNNCQQIENPKFTACKLCVENCMNKFAADSSMRMFECESRCE